MFELLSLYLPQNPLQHSLALLGLLALFSMFAFYVTSRLMLTFIARISRKTSTHLDDILINHNVFNRLAYVVPSLIFYNFAYVIPQFTVLIQRASLSLMALAGLLMINSFLNAVGDIYQQSKYAERINIKSYIQITKLIINILGAIIIVAILINGRNKI